MKEDILKKVLILNFGGQYNEVKGVNRVLYDITGKPPATVEFE